VIDTDAKLRATVDVKAAVISIAGAPWTVETVSIDMPRADEIRVRIAGAGICHTDLVFAASAQVMPCPAVLGHEGAGVVEAVGNAVTGVEPGDHVVLTFDSCATCERCSAGHPAYCSQFFALNYAGCRSDGSSAIMLGESQVNCHFFGQSSFATHAIVSERNAVVIDKDLPLHLMGPLGCGVQTGAGSIMKALACPADSSLLVTGAGTVGLSAVLGAVIQGCKHIIVVEPKEARRRMALELGATHVIDPSDGPVVEAVRKILPDGVAYAFDTSGRSAVMLDAVLALASGGTLALVGVASDPVGNVSLPINHLISAGLRVVGIIEGDVEPQKFIPEMARLYKAGQFPFEKLIRTYPLDEVNDAIADQLSGACIKPVLIP
jgi:aryl-alcohol dehydrogenase